LNKTFDTQDAIFIRFSVWISVKHEE